MSTSSRRPVIAVIGNGGEIPQELSEAAKALGQQVIDAGFRLVTGGLGGVMEAASLGAHQSEKYQEGDVVGILPSYDRATANPWVDIAIPTGNHLGRNIIVVAMADVVIAVAGASGTLSEISLAWQLGKPVIALQGFGGWSEKLAGQCVDHRYQEPIAAASNAEEAIQLACAFLQQKPLASRDSTS